MSDDLTNPLFNDFISNLGKINKVDEAGEKIHIDELAGNVYFVYEKMRNAVEYQEQHLFRRSAIERLIKRTVFVNENDLKGLSKSIIKELIKTRYLENNTLPISTIETVDKILSRYHSLFVEIKNKEMTNNKNHLHNILMMAACEIENAIWSYAEEQIYLDFVYKNFCSAIETDVKEDRDSSLVAIYFAVHRSLWKSDKYTINYYLYRSFFPDWFKSDGSSSDKFVDSYISFSEHIEKITASAIYSRINKIVRKNIAPYRIIRIALIEKKKFEDINDPDAFMNKINLVLKNEYLKTKQRTNRKIIQAIIYIFLTKVLLALILEFPYDYFVNGSINYVPLIINLLFPPAYMFLLASLIPSPGKRNTQEINTRIESIIYKNTSGKKFKVSGAESRTNVGIVLLYIFTFIISFLLSIYLLYILQFNIVSGLIFFIYFSTVTYFGYRISQGAREYSLIDEKKSIREALLDFFTFPFIKLGRWLGDKYANLNIIAFVLDYMIEMPLKTVLIFFENWSSMINKEKEDLLDR
ncbi:MAG: hypothetical protein WCI63_02100 [bacterium]